MDYAGARYLISGTIPIVTSSTTDEWAVDLDIGLFNELVNNLTLKYLKLMSFLGLSVSIVEIDPYPQKCINANALKRK